MKKKTKNLLLVFVLIALVGGFLGIYFGTDIISKQSSEEITTVQTDPSLLVYDWYSGEMVDDDDGTLYMYRAKISGIAEEDLEEYKSDFSNYELDKTYEVGDDVDYDEEYTYWGKWNSSDRGEQWVQPIKGTDIVMTVANLTEDVFIAPVSSDELSTTFVNTSYDEWTLMTQTVDANNESTNKQGYISYYDFEDDEYKNVVLRVEFNSTASLGYADLNVEHEYTEKCSGNYTFYQVSMDLFGTNEFDLELNSELGSSYEVEQVAIGYGTADSMTVWDTAA